MHSKLSTGKATRKNAVLNNVYTSYRRKANIEGVLKSSRSCDKEVKAAAGSISSCSTTTDSIPAQYYASFTVNSHQIEGDRYTTDHLPVAVHEIVKRG